MAPHNLQAISDSASIAEGLVLRWFKRLDAINMTPDMELLNQGLDALTRVTAIRKAITHLSAFDPSTAPAHCLSYDFGFAVSESSSVCSAPSVDDHSGSTSSTGSTGPTGSTLAPQSQIRTPQSPREPSLCAVRSVSEVPVLPLLPAERIETEIEQVRTSPLLRDLPPESCTITRYDDGSISCEPASAPEPVKETYNDDGLLTVEYPPTRPGSKPFVVTYPANHPFLHPEIEEEAIRRHEEIYGRNKKKKPG